MAIPAPTTTVTHALIFSGVIVPATASSAAGLPLRMKLASNVRNAAVSAMTSASLVHTGTDSPQGCHGPPYRIENIIDRRARLAPSPAHLLAALHEKPPRASPHSLRINGACRS